MAHLLHIQPTRATPSKNMKGGLFIKEGLGFCMLLPPGQDA